MEFRLASSFQVSDSIKKQSCHLVGLCRPMSCNKSLFRVPEPCHQRQVTSLNHRPSQVPVVIKHSPKGSLTLAAAQVQLSIKVYKHKASPASSTQPDRQTRHPAVWTGRCHSLHLLEATAGKHRAGILE